MNKRIENPHLMGFKRRFSRKVRQRHGRYNESDHSIFMRVIKDGYDGKEFIVSGDSETTFGQACKNQWQFESVSRNSSWYIKDERGNDVTDMFLISSDGICILISEYGSEKKTKDRDKASRYSSI
ncbi:MAG: hypothetical protein E4H14_02895 [Candidatus Thorarchaeota archaeon]|nr:MAG: hypothetical protein E4H14_02895 [Candidatus Thorarchaeota archaeon]